MCLRSFSNMAEDFDKRHKQSKVFNVNPNLQVNLQTKNDLMSQSGRKKGKSTAKGGGKMNPTGTSGHQSSSSSNTASKTVAAILKQQKDFKAAEKMSAPRTQHVQHQFQTKRSSHKNSPSSAAALQDNLSYIKSVTSPAGLAGSTTPASISPAMSPSNAQGVSPSGKELNHSAITTKSSSLSRELSPSRITAQIVKVMSDTSQSSTQNLLLSVLQGNMPDPMGLLNSSKPDVSSVQTSNHAIPSVSRLPLTGKANNPANTLPSQHNSFSSLTSSLFDSGLFLNQSTTNLEDGGCSSPDSLSSLPQVHAGSLSTASINVSHIPKTTNIPSGLSLGGPLTSGHSLPSSSPRHSPRSAMEVAQQIKLEANGQSTSAQKVAMQQQLRSQIKGSRSLDAQLTSRQNTVVPSTGPSTDHLQSFTNSHQLHPMKDMEQQKTLEASMPLLASKLSSVQSSPSINNNSGLLQHTSSSKTNKPNLPLTASLLKSPLPSSVNSSNLHSFSVVSTSSISPLQGRKSVHQAVSSLPKSLAMVDSRQHRQQQPLQQQHQHLQKQLQQQPVSSLSMASPSSMESVSNEAWLQSQKNSFLPMSVASSISVGGIGITDHNKQLMLQKLIQASDATGLSEHTVQTDMVLKTEGQAQTGNLVSKHGRSVISNTVSPGQSLGSGTTKGSKMSQSIQAVGIGGLGQTLHSVLPTASVVAAAIERRRKSGPGESKQTAIDVDMDFGNLASIATDDQNSLITTLQQVAFSNAMQGGGGDDSMLVPMSAGDKFTTLYQQQQQFSKIGDGGDGSSSNMSNATFVKDITGVSNPNGSSADLSSFLPIHSSNAGSTSFFSKTSGGTLQVVDDPLQTSTKPISYPYLSTASINIATSVATAAAVSSFLQPSDFISPSLPPPPYPSSNKSTHSFQQLQQNQNLLQQQQQQLQIQQQQQQQQRQQQQLQQQQQQVSKSSSKHAVRNPFTFPTTGVKLQTEHDSSGLLSYTISPHPVGEQSTDNKPFGKDDILLSTLKDHKPLAFLDKSPSDITAYFSRLQSGQPFEGVKGGMPRLLPQATIKLEGPIDHQQQAAIIKTEANGPVDRLSLDQPFNQRVANLSSLPVTNTTYRAAYRSHAVAAQRARSGVITNTAKSLDVLRQNLQRSINKDISEIIKKYTSKFFEPALANIRQNNNEDLLGNEHINYVCRQILEEAKLDYSASPGRRSATPTTDIFDNVSDNGSINGKRSHNAKRSRISDSDSEKGSDAGSVRRTIKRKGRPPVHGSGRVTPSKPFKAGDVIRKEGPKWDPDRLKPETQFIMGAKANKALGLGNTRGRLYIRHPDIFKYVGDSDDKLWLCDRSLMPPTGGKAYLMLVEDIEDLSRSGDYRDSPSLLMHECVGFTVPEWMQVKMKEQMASQRTDGPRKYFNAEEPEVGTIRKPLPFSSFAEIVKVEAQSSPADTEDMEFLSTMDCEEEMARTARPSSTTPPFNVTNAGFDDAGVGGGLGGSLSELDQMDDRLHMATIFT